MPRSEGTEGGRIGSPTRSVARTLPRPRSSASIVHSAFATTKRDIRICLDLYEHRVLTTDQVFELRFLSLRRAQQRLLLLHRRGIVERFRPFRSSGSHPWHYILSEVGLHIVAAWRGVDRKDLKVHIDRLRAVAYSPRLSHLVEVNGFFTRLAYRCRDGSGLRLAEWWSERRCASDWGGMVRPDGLGLLRGSGVDVRFFLEVDRGTETSTRLEEKLARYARVARFPDAPEAVLFLFPSERREAEARRILVNPGMVVLTGTRASAGQDPLGPFWLPSGADRRLRITDVRPGRRAE
jgi:hypothetical protein